MIIVDGKAEDQVDQLAVIRLVDDDHHGDGYITPIWYCQQVQSILLVDGDSHGDSYITPIAC